MTTHMDDEEVIKNVIDSVAKKSDLSRDQVETAVREEYDALAGRPVRDYVSILTERAVLKRFKTARKRATAANESPS